MGVMRTEPTDPPQPPGLHNGALKAAEVLVAVSHESMAPGPAWLRFEKIEKRIVFNGAEGKS